MDATAVEVTWVERGGKDLRGSQAQAELPLLLLLLWGQDNVTNPTLHWGQRAGGIARQGPLCTPREPSPGP